MLEVASVRSAGSESILVDRTAIATLGLLVLLWRRRRLRDPSASGFGLARRGQCCSLDLEVGGNLIPGIASWPGTTMTLSGSGLSKVSLLAGRAFKLRDRILFASDQRSPRRVGS